MGFFSDAFASKSVTSTLDLFREVYGGKKSSSGRTVNVNTAIDVSTVFACCRVVGEGLAQVPFKLMQESPDGKTRLPAKKHSLYKKLALKPNRWQTSFEYREMLVWHVLLCGNHYSFINRIGNKIVELYPFEPNRVQVTFESGVLSYKVTTEEGRTQDFPASAIWHVRGPSLNGWYGLEAVKHAREAIGLSMTLEETAGSMTSKGVNTSGVYSVEGTLSPEQYKGLAKWIEENVSGSANAGKPLILDRAAKWVSTQMSGVDAQALEQRRFQIEEICRFARVMPIMVGYSDKATTYASAEQMFLAHLVHTMAPWYERIEQSANVNLLTEKEQNEGYYTNFVEEGMLRGAAVDTKDVILGYVNGGILTPNEGRAKLDENPDPDPASDKLRIPANIVGSLPTGDINEQSQVTITN
jgi:HK97 family phage portal protein